MKSAGRTLVLAAVLCVSVGAQTQQPAPAAMPTGTGVISGVLVRAGSADPLRKAPMRISSRNPGVVKMATTDQDGRFLFDQLPPADYTLTATKPGFLEAVYGARRPGASEPGTAIKLGAGQKIDTISFALSPSSTIFGTIRDEFGDPASQVPVRALRLGYRDGERTLTPTGNGTTDDRGQYRIPNLVPGEYLVTAIPRETAEFNAELEAARKLDALFRLQDQTGGDVAKAEIERLFAVARASTPLGYVPVYFPGVIQPSASSAVRVGLSEEVGAIDMRLQMGQTAAISGIVTSDEPLPALASVQLVDPAMPLNNISQWLRKTDKDGRFTYTGLLPGTYVLHAFANLPPTTVGASNQLTAEQRVVVAPGAPSEYTLRIERGITVAGQIDVGSLRGSVDVSTLRVTLYPVSNWQVVIPMWRETPDSAGRFAARGVSSGRYSVRVDGLPAGWSLASAMFGGREAADLHLIVEAGKTYSGKLTFTDRTAEVTGVVATAAGTPSAQHTVIVFPVDQAMWLPSSRRIQALQPAADGRYSARGLPAGDYRLIAIQDPDNGAWFNAAYLTTLVPLSMPFTLGEGDRKTMDIRVR